MEAATRAALEDSLSRKRVADAKLEAGNLEWNQTFDSVMRAAADRHRKRCKIERTSEEVKKEVKEEPSGSSGGAAGVKEEPDVKEEVQERQGGVCEATELVLAEVKQETLEAKRETGARWRNASRGSNKGNKMNQRGKQKREYLMTIRE